MKKISLPMEEAGSFWLPDEHNKSAPGILRISESGRATLEITTQFHLTLPPSQDNPHLDGNNDSFKRILGSTASNHITLENCSVMKLSFNLRSNLAKRIIQVELAFMGARYEKYSEITFSKIGFSMEGLDEWLDIPVGTVNDDIQNKSVSITCSLPEPITIQLPGEGMKLSFTFRAEIGFGIKEMKITQRAYAILESEELLTLNDFLEVINRLHRFLCFAIGKTVPITSITGYSREATQETGQSEEEQEIQIFYEGMPIPNTNLKIERHNMLFTYRDIKDQFEVIINNWLTNYKEFRQAFDQYFVFQESKATYIEWPFLSLMHGLQAFQGKSCQKEKLTGQKEKLAEIIKPFQHLYGGEELCVELVDNSVRARNELVHLDNKPETDYPELMVLRSKLDALFQLHFLKLCGMSESAIDDLAKRLVLDGKIKGFPNNRRFRSFMGG